MLSLNGALDGLGATAVGSGAAATLGGICSEHAVKVIASPNEIAAPWDILFAFISHSEPRPKLRIDPHQRPTEEHVSGRIPADSNLSAAFHAGSTVMLEARKAPLHKDARKAV